MLLSVAGEARFAHVCYQVKAEARFNNKLGNGRLPFYFLKVADIKIRLSNIDKINKLY